MEATAWIALVALGFTGAQAWIAHRKLRFDLYSKRFEVWEEFNKITNEAIIAVHDDKNIDDTIYNDRWRSIRAKRRSITSLFPPDVAENANNIEMYLANLEIAASRIKDGDDMGQSEYLHNLFQTADVGLRIEQDELSSRVHRYIRQYGWIELFGVAIRKRSSLWRASKIDRS